MDWFDLAGAAISLGVFFSTNTVVAHELVHQTRNPAALFTGRMLLAFSCDTQFAVAHVYGHHRHVATPADPASARRGESLYAFMIRSTIGQWREALAIETARLSKSRHSLWSWRNRFLRGQLLTLALVCFCAFAGGIRAVAAFFLCAALAKAFLESINYIQHYGLARAKGSLIEPRHSWDCTHRASSTVLYNLPRHADHHANANIPYWELKPHATAVKMRFGYLGTILIATIPPLWRRFTRKELAYWDEHLATPQERALAQGALAVSQDQALAQELA